MLDGKNDKALLAGAFLGVLGLWIAAGCVVYYSLGQWDHRGQFGDMFGAVNALFSGLALAGVVITIFLQSQEHTRSARALQSTMWATLDAIVTVERSISEVPTAIRFHGITSKELKEAGISADEFAYLLSSFTAGHIYHMSHDAGNTAPFAVDSYRYRMLQATATQDAWPLIRRCLNKTSYVDRLEATLKSIQATQKGTAQVSTVQDERHQ